MNFDSTWNKVYSKREWGIYPNEHLVRFVNHHFTIASVKTALDIGCGSGAQTRMLARHGFDVIGIDGANGAIRRLRNKKAPRIRCRTIDVCEFDTKQQFDLIVDICTLQHLSFDDAKLVIDRALKWLRPGGWFFSVMAADNFEMKCEILPRIADHDDAIELFSGYRVRLGRECVERPNGDRTDHWIIEAHIDG